MLKRSVREEHCTEVRSVVEKCWRRVFQRSVVQTHFSEVSEKSALEGEEFCREVL